MKNRNLTGITVLVVAALGAVMTTTAADQHADDAGRIADLTAQVGSLTDQLADAQQAARPAPVPETIPSGLRAWHGFTVGEVIICPKGWTVSIDDGDTTGQTWAACM